MSLPHERRPVRSRRPLLLRPADAEPASMPIPPSFITRRNSAIAVTTFAPDRHDRRVRPSSGRKIGMPRRLTTMSCPAPCLGEFRQVGQLGEIMNASSESPLRPSRATPSRKAGIAQQITRPSPPWLPGSCWMPRNTRYRLWHAHRGISSHPVRVERRDRRATRYRGSAPGSADRRASLTGKSGFADGHEVLGTVRAVADAGFDIDAARRRYVCSCPRADAAER